MARDPQFTQAKEDAIDNLKAIQRSLIQCVEEGMIDLEDAYYNEVLGLLEDASIVDSWDELLEIITLAKTLEIDVAAWLSRHGRTSLSLPWPNRPPAFPG